MIPTAYSEAELAGYMLSQLGDLAAVLGWTGLAPVQEAVNEVELTCGALATAPDVVMLRTVARREVWRLAVASLAVRTDFTNPEGQYKRSQMLAAAIDRLKAAEADALVYDTAGAGRVSIAAVIHSDDPYRVLTDSEMAALG